ncbi:MAG: 4'-phosphopantetheinyl transferase superfamily protein, partial [Salinisphaera sp.]|uniref:4'-phosphopantetheinyl transferase family protein n=1 Tax=Salinisphaera sp. TaxID=1914330 RepID=UPI003C7D00B3
VYDDTVDPVRLLAGLDHAERDRHARIASERRRREYLASRWLLRQHLAAELGAAPQAVALEYPPGGPPRSADTAWHLGLSHSGLACMSLVADAPAGCDIERVKTRRFAPERLAAHCFHPDEVADLGAAAPTDRLGDFHRLWTLKESALKARGLGLGAGMTRPSFALRPRLSCTRAPDGDDWYFGAYDLEFPGGRFALAVATARPAATIHLARMQPLSTGGAQHTALELDWQITARN